MKPQEFIEKVAAGLRKMDTKPDYLLFIINKTDWIYDLPELCGIPVIYSYIPFNSGYDGDEFIIFPCFKYEFKQMEVYNFQRGFTEN